MTRLLRKEDIKTINNVDDMIDRKTFRYIMYQMYAITLDIVAMLAALISQTKNFNITDSGFLLDASIVLVTTMFIILNKVSFYSSMKRMILENRGTMYSSKSVAITDDYAYIKGMRPIKVRLIN